MMKLLRKEQDNDDDVGSRSKILAKLSLKNLRNKPWSEDVGKVLQVTGEIAQVS